MEMMLQTQNLCKYFRKQKAVNNVSLNIEKGQIYGLLGPNGAGKSTTLKMLTGMMKPTAGKIYFDGKLLDRKDLSKIGALIENPPIYENLSARENLKVRQLLLGTDENRIDEVLQIVSLTNTGKKKAGQFSLGMKQRLGIAMALLGEPELLILDEPTNGLDPIGIEELRELIRSFPEQGITVILSSHILRIDRSEILATVLQSDIEKIKQTLESVDNHAFELAVDTILAAKKVYVIGIRSCAPLAKFLTFYLNLICEDVVEVDTNSSSEIFEQLIRIGEEDVIIGISFPRYSMRTLKALEFASNRKAKVITLTDSVHSPMNLYSSCNLIARSDMASIVDSLVAPLSVVNALVVALCMKKQDDVITRLETLEQIWDEYQVYSKDEMNLVGDKVEMSGFQKEEGKHE